MADRMVSRSYRWRENEMNKEAGTLRYAGRVVAITGDGAS